MPKRTLVALVMLSSMGLSSCATTRVVCLPMKNYDITEQAQLAVKLREADPGIQGLVQDYFAMRTANRACQGKK